MSIEQGVQVASKTLATGGLQAEKASLASRINWPKAATLGALVAASLGAKKLQIDGHTEDLQPQVKAAVESGGHLMFGYVGAWAGHAAAKARTSHESISETIQNRRITAGASIGVFVTNLTLGEMGEGVRTRTYFDFMRHWFDGKLGFGETTKDLVVGAGLGAVLYAASHRLRQEPYTQATN